MSQKPTTAELELRTATIAEMLIKGFNRQDVIRYASEKWSVTERTVDNYLHSAWEKIEKITEKDLERLKNLAIRRYEDLYKKNYNVQDYRECRQVEKDIVELFGIGERQKLDITSNGESMKPVIEIVRPDESK